MRKEQGKNDIENQKRFNRDYQDKELKNHYRNKAGRMKVQYPKQSKL